MRRLSAWLAGAAGGLAAYRLLRRRRGVSDAPTEPPAQPATGPDPRAEELRAKLAEKETASSEEAHAEPAAPEHVEARRASVHEQGRAAIEEMRGGDPPAAD